MYQKSISWKISEEDDETIPNPQNSNHDRINILKYTTVINYTLSYKQKLPTKVFYINIDVIKNFAKFKGKHLCSSFIFNEVADLEQDLQLY